MSNLLLTLTASMLCQGASAVSAPAVEVAPQPTFLNSFTDQLPSYETVNAPNRKVYAFFQNNITSEGYGIGTFNMNNTMQPELLYAFDAEEMMGFYAGAVANGIFYGATYQYQSAQAPVTLDLMSIDLLTGEKRYVGPWTTNESMKLQDMAYDYSTNTMYAVGYNLGRSYLYTLDLATGATTQVGQLPMTFFGIAINYKGDLFGVESNTGSIYKLNKETARIADYVVAGICQGFVTNQSMEFDHTTGKLYWAAMARSIDGGQASYLYEIDVEADLPSINNLGEIRRSEMLYGSPIIGMYIPYVLAGEQAPAAVSNINFTTDPTGELKTTISFTAPSINFGGAELSDLTSITITRNDETIATITTAEVGKAIEFVDDKVPANG